MRCRRHLVVDFWTTCLVVRFSAVFSGNRVVWLWLSCLFRVFRLKKLKQQKTKILSWYLSYFYLFFSFFHFVDGMRDDLENGWNWNLSENFFDRRRLRGNFTAMLSTEFVNELPGNTWSGVGFLVSLAEATLFQSFWFCDGRWRSLYQATRIGIPSSFTEFS